MKVDEKLVRIGDNVLVWAYGIKRVGVVEAIDGVRAVVRYTSSSGLEKFTLRHQRELKVIVQCPDAGCSIPNSQQLICEGVLPALMASLTYGQLINEGMRLYRDGKYAEAYELITAEASRLEGKPAQALNFRFDLASRAGRHDLALRIMHQAIIEKRFWYSKEYLEDDDLAPLCGSNEFRELAEVCSKREKRARKDSKLELVVEWASPSSQAGNRPIVVALHGNEQNASVSRMDFMPPKRLLSLALPQSSQTEFSGGYFWNDFEKGLAELADHLQSLKRESKLDLCNIVVGRFSAGARVALYSTLKGLIKPKVFILVGPWVPEIEQWGTLIDMSGRNVKGYIIFGDMDEDCLELSKEVSAMLNARGIGTEFTQVRGS